MAYTRQIIDRPKGRTLWVHFEDPEIGFRSRISMSVSVSQGYGGGTSEEAARLGRELARTIFSLLGPSS